MNTSTCLGFLNEKILSSRKALAAGLVISCLTPMAAFATSPAKIPNPLEYKMIELMVKKDSLEKASETDRKLKEIARAKEIAKSALELTENAETKSTNTYRDRVAAVTRNNQLALSGAQVTDLLIEGDKAKRLERIQKATKTKLGQEELERIDDDLFWATVGRGEDATGEDFDFDDGTGVSVRLDPETREGTVNVYDTGEESGLPLDVVLPTRWKKVEESDPDSEDLLTPKDSSYNVIDEVNAPPPEPEVDDSVPPSVMTKDDFQLTFDTIAGMWKVNSEIWHISVSDPLAGDVLNSKEDFEKRLASIEEELDEIGTGRQVHVWENSNTGEKVTQKRFKRLKGEEWEYTGEEPDPESQAKIDELKGEKNLLLGRLGRTPEDQKLDPSGFNAVKATGRPVTIKVIKGEQCPFNYTSAYFDGRTLAAEYHHDKRCTLNVSFTETIKTKLLSGSYPRNIQAIMRVSNDPRRNLLVLKGKEWIRNVHHDRKGTKVNRVSGLFEKKSLTGEKPRDDSYLTNREMGASDDTSL